MKKIKSTLLISLILLAVLSLSLWLKPNKPNIVLKPSTFKQLPGWEKARLHQSFSAFKKSCHLFIKFAAEKNVGSALIPLQAKDLKPACQKALALNKPSNAQIKHFYQQYFVPVSFYQNNKQSQGLFTGYYQPLLHGSLQKTVKYHVPLYGSPSDLLSIDLSDFGLKKQKLTVRVEGKKILPYFEREQINQGAIEKTANVIAWVDNRIDRLFLEIQGSGVIELEDGQKLYVGYEGQNGAPYTPLAKVLIDKGVMTKDNASMQRIRAYLNQHPNLMDKILNSNKSFVFFRRLKQQAAIGAQNLPLSPGYSLAIDKRYIPLGSPLWLSTHYPGAKKDNEKILQRLMIAQDTGGAIKGVVRGDVFWGEGENATAIAGRMKNKGVYWLFVPKKVWQAYPNSNSILTIG